SFDAKRGATLLVPVAPRSGIAARNVLLVGLGDRNDIDLETFRRAGAAIARKARDRKSVAVALGTGANGRDPADVSAAIAEGVRLGGYQFQRYRSEPKRTALTDVTILGSNSRRTNGAIATALCVAEATMWARDMVNEPAAAKSPAHLAAAAQK